MTLQSRSLDLIAKSRDECLAMIEAFGPEVRAQLSPDWLARLHASTDSDPWVHGFKMILRENSAKVGDCGFKAPPDAEGMVEIAYGVEPDHQGKGYATEAAEALVKFASGHSEVKTIRAHTLPEKNASTRVLTKCEFRFVGDVIDPEDGPVWRWELSEG